MSQAIASSKAVLPTEHVYSVLYYKSKNKVHKSKGVKKMDGILSVAGPPRSLVTLKDCEDSNTTLLSRIQNEIANRQLQVDDVIVIGGYEVEILTVESHKDEGKGVDATGLKNLSTLSGQRSTLRSKFPLRPSTNVASGLRTPKSFLSSRTYRQPTQRKVVGDIRGGALHSGPTDSVTEDDNQERVTVDSTTGSLRAQTDKSASPREDSGTQVKPSHTKGRVSAKRKVSPFYSSVGNSPRDATRRRIGMPTSSKSPLLASRNTSSSRCPASSGMPTHGIRRTTRVPSGPCPSSAQKLVTNHFPGAVELLDVPHAIKRALKPHQVEGVTFLWNRLTGKGKTTLASTSPAVDNDVADFAHKGCILADEMGLGKTLMTIAAICALHRKKRDMRFIVVCPSTLVSNWAKEFDKWLGKASLPKRVVVKKGGEEGIQQIKAFSQANKRQPSQVLILSYDLLRRNSSIFTKPGLTRSIGLLVVDEGHRLKNTSGSLTMEALHNLKAQARLLLTATPIQNVLSEFYALADFCCPGVLGDLTTFRREFERPIAASNNNNCSAQQRQRGLEQSQAFEEITRTFMLRRLQKDVLRTALPPREEVLLFSRPTHIQCDLYKSLTAHDGESNYTEGCGATTDALTTLTSLRRLCLHPVLAEPSVKGTQDSFDLASSSKLTLLDDLLSQIRETAPDDKVVIVSNFTAALSMIELSILRPRGHAFVRLDGSTEQKARQGIVDTFNQTSSKRSFAFLLSSKAGGCGLNLIGANRLVMFDPDWNPATDIQAMARVYRHGQVKPCVIYRLFTSGTVEEIICQRQIQKGNLAVRTVDGALSSPAGNDGFSKEEIRDCFTLKEDCDCDTKLKMGSRWAPYDGQCSIEAQGCTDPPLLAIASKVDSRLAFVHVVSQHDEAVDNLQEEEVQVGIETSIKEPSLGSDSSDEEFEFT